MEHEPVVFIVDDDAAARDAVAAMVQSKGVRTAVFASADDFLRAYERDQVGCLVTDVRMPGMTGLELQQALIEREFHLPVILITGYGDVSTAVKAMQAGAYTFLQKPCADRELWASIQRALASSERQTLERGQKDEILRRLKELSPDELRVMRKMILGKSNKVMSFELSSTLGS